MSECNLFWFRRDLRLEDNTGLRHALKAGLPLIPVFIFDTDILKELSNPYDKRVQFIYDALSQLNRQLKAYHSCIDVRYGAPKKIFEDLTEDYRIHTVFTNHDYEPSALQRDQGIAALLKAKGIGFQTFKDQVIFEKDEVVTKEGKPYSVYTPYSRQWNMHLSQDVLAGHRKTDLHRLAPLRPKDLPRLPFFKLSEKPHFHIPPVPEKEIIRNYHATRDLPYVKGTTHMGVHLRFGTISIRKLVQEASQLNETFLGELVWREFFMQILWHYPQVVHHSFKPVYDHIRWRNKEEEFRRWREGETGVPIVDAGMRELNETGFMHNRVRMITASYLIKHLLIDWRWGEAYFAQKLLDYELASNNGNWQWVAGCGCDAAPYFRIFNPDTQTKRFDPHLEYISTWVPEWQHHSYPKPMVEHSVARDRCLQAYKAAQQYSK